MMIDVDNRGTGKTTSLIFDAYHTGYPIVVATHQRKRTVEDLAQSMHIEVRVFTVKELIGGEARGDEKFMGNNEVIVDELEDVLNTALGVRVVRANMSRRV